MIRIWGRNTSTNVRKVLWLLDELGLVYERIDAGGPFANTDTPEFRAMSPMGLVPTLEEDAYTLFESNAILRYIVNAHALGSTLYPSEPKTRGRVDAWLDWQQTGLRRLQRGLMIDLARGKVANGDDAATARRIEEAGRTWGAADTQLRRTPWIAGSEFTIADIALGVGAYRWFRFDIKRPDHPHLKAWCRRLTRRPAFLRYFPPRPSPQARVPRVRSDRPSEMLID
jgi:glutathione S-transferase